MVTGCLFKIFVLLGTLLAFQPFSGRYFEIEGLADVDEEMQSAAIQQRHRHQ